MFAARPPAQQPHSYSPRRWIKRAIIMASAVALSLSAARAAQPAGIAGAANMAPKRPLSVVVYGDSQATDLFSGLRWIAPRTRHLRFKRRSLGGTGLVRDDQFDWERKIVRLIANDRPDIIVISLGGNDRQALRLGRARLKHFTMQWWLEYRRRAAAVMRAARASGARVYWLSLPPVRSTRTTQDYYKLNTFFSDLTRREGVGFVNITPLFASRKGLYQAAGRDVFGRRRRLRRADGIHYSIHGARLLAYNVVREISRNTGEDTATPLPTRAPGRRPVNR